MITLFIKGSRLSNPNFYLDILIYVHFYCFNHKNVFECEICWFKSSSNNITNENCMKYRHIHENTYCVIILQGHIAIGNILQSLYLYNYNGRHICKTNNLYIKHSL